MSAAAFDILLFAGADATYGHKDTDAVCSYLDQNPHDGSGADITSGGAIDTSGWIQNYYPHNRPL